MIDVVNELLRKAFQRIEMELPEDEQEQFARFLMELIESDERQWKAQFAASQEQLSNLADQALEEYSRGLTKVLDPTKL